MKFLVTDQVGLQGGQVPSSNIKQMQTPAQLAVAPPMISQPNQMVSQSMNIMAQSQMNAVQGLATATPMQRMPGQQFPLNPGKGMSIKMRYKSH